MDEATNCDWTEVGSSVQHPQHHRSALLSDDAHMHPHSRSRSQSRSHSRSPLRSRSPLYQNGEDVGYEDGPDRFSGSNSYSHDSYGSDHDTFYNRQLSSGTATSQALSAVLPDTDFGGGVDDDIYGNI